MGWRHKARTRWHCTGVSGALALAWPGGCESAVEINKQSEAVWWMLQSPDALALHKCIWCAGAGMAWWL